jgi:hypothetical protein
LGHLPLRAQPGDRPVYLSLADARPILDSFAAELPAGLGSPPDFASWSMWQAAHDKEIRARLKRGDADSIVNLVLFGASFTAQRRLTARQMEKAGDDSEAIGKLILARIQDLASAVLHPGPNERLRFAAAWLNENGVDVSDPAADKAVLIKRIIVLLLENTRRVLREQNAYTRAIDAARSERDTGSLFTVRSSLYRDRGVSLDTSFRPNFAIERSLAGIKAAGLMRQIRRAAVIGPGLDFTDKRSGYDFYPIQTLQPFALVDSLRRLRLADTAGPSVDIVDISRRVLDHVRLAVAQARRGSAYTVQIPLDRDTRWLPETTGYWMTFGSEIGGDAPPLTAPPGVEVRMRAVSIRTDVVKLLRPVDLNVVLQHVPLAEDRKLDIIVATNVMLYYPPFEQALALRNIAGMLRKGGLLLSNNALPQIPGLQMRHVGATSAAYSEDPDDGDNVLWYARV